ncbi:MAG: hypothetical protein U9P90_01125 [Patescibacteria group bacterium]|nr:hypothetical protein [Patescibacteria group bacterium]
MSKPTTLDNIFERYKKEAGDSRISKLQFIKDLNDLLFELPITKPAEQESKIYYIDEFYEYAIPSDMRESIALYSDQVKIIRYVSNLRFRLESPVAAYTDRVDAGQRFLNIRHPSTNSDVTSVTECDSLTADGAWVLSGGASGASIDTNTKKSGSGSLKFTINGTGGVLTFTRTNAIDASAFTEKMRERLFAWLPVAPLSMEIRAGNDSSNYFSHTITTQANGKIFTTEDKNELEFAEESAVETGTVDKKNIYWFQFRFTFGAIVSNANFRFDKISLAKPEILDFEYYTNNVAITESGALQDKITENDSTTDEPIIKEYSDYINTIIDGLCASHLKNKAPARAERYRKDYISKRDGNKNIIGGIEFLLKRYPSRRASYQRKTSLPALNRQIARGSKFV